MRQAVAAARSRQVAAAAAGASEEPRPDPPAPPGLGAAGLELWASVVAGFQVEPHQAAILAAACPEADVAAAADLAVASGGPFVRNRFGQLVLHPGVGAARQARLACARLLKQLGPEEAA